MSRMAASGARTSSSSRWPSGRTNAWTVTSFGMSWAAGRAATAASSAASTSDARTCSGAAGCIPRSVYWRAHRGETDPLRFDQVTRIDSDSSLIAVGRARWLASATASDSRAAQTPRAARVPGRSAVAEAAAESLALRIDHRRGRRRAGSHLGRASRRRFAERAHRDRRWRRIRRRPSRAALPAPRCWSSIAPARSSATGAVPATATTGRARPAASPSTRRATSGLPRPASPNAAAGRGGRGGARPATPPQRRRRPPSRTLTCSSSRAPASSCCRSARPASRRATTARRR